MSDDEDKNLFWGEMEARLDQDDDEAFHRALDDLEPPQRGGAAAAAVEDEAGGAGPSRVRFDFRLDPTPSSIDGVNAWASTNASSGLGCTNGAPSTTTPSWPRTSWKGWGHPWPRCYKILASPIGIGFIFIWLPTAYATLMTVGVWPPGNGVVMKATWHAYWRIWAACSIPTKTSKWTTPSTCRLSIYVPAPTAAARSANTCRAITPPPVWKSWKSRSLPSPKRTKISAVPEPLSPPGPRRKITPSGDPSSEGCHSNWIQPWNSTREPGSVRDRVAPTSCTSLPWPSPNTRWWWWTPIGPTRVSLMVAVPNSWGSCTRTAIIMPWPACRASLVRGITAPGVTSPTIMLVNMPAPTLSPIVAVVCRMGALITEKPTLTTSPPPCPAHPVAAPSTALPVWPTTLVSPTMANRPDPDALRSARAARNVGGVSNCCGGDKRGKSTAVSMPHVRPVRSKWTFRPTAASSKWHHPRRRTRTPPHDPSTSSSTSKVDRRTDITSPTWWWPKPKWRMTPSVSRGMIATPRGEIPPTEASVGTDPE